MKQHLTAFVSGALFSLGMAVSGMALPEKVIGFLDVTGKWDPTLGFVMAGALAVFMPSFPLVMRRSRPIVSEKFDLPVARRVTVALVAGAAIFGIGWGICGVCPAAAITALPAVPVAALVMSGGIAIGIFTMRRAREVLAGQRAREEVAAGADF